MTDLMHDRLKVLLVLEREKATEYNVGVIAACDAALRAIDRDPRWINLQSARARGQNVSN